MDGCATDGDDGRRETTLPYPSFRLRCPVKKHTLSLFTLGIGACPLDSAENAHWLPLPGARGQEQHAPFPHFLLPVKTPLFFSFLNLVSF